jgi:hypothetical protein
MLYYLDSNIVIYAVEGQPPFQQRARNHIAALESAGHRFVISEHKSDHFPEAAEDGPIINPCEDEPADHFRFDFDPVAKLASVYGVTPRGVVTENLLGLNRPALRSYRSTRIRHLIALARFAESDAEAAALLKAARRSDEEYAAFARPLFPSPKPPTA